MGKETDEPEVVPYYDKNLGGVRPGSGRPKGVVSYEKRLLAETRRLMAERVVGLTDKLLSAQLTIALGESALYMKTVKGNKTITTKIDDPEIIKQYINGEFDDHDNEYYYITTKSPDNKALDSILDRTFGKAQASLDLTSDGERLETQPVSKTIIANFKEYMLASTKEPGDDED